MFKIENRKNLAGIVSLIGLASFLYGFFYNVSTFLNPHASSIGLLMFFGYILFIVAAIIARIYWLAIGLATVVVAYFGLMFLMAYQII